MDIRSCNAELEEIERELSYILKNPSGIKTLIEAERHEHILEETLKHVQLRKKMLENGYINPVASEGGFYPNNINPSGFFVGSSSYNPDMPPEVDAVPTGFHFFSNQAPILPGMIQTQSPTLFQGYNWPYHPYAHNNEAATDGYNVMPQPQPQPQLGQFVNDPYIPQPYQFGPLVDMNLPPLNITREQENGAKAIQNEAGNNGAMGHYAPTNGIPFPF
ncbi:uncharacterized protein LOC126656676 [Mercurialis annua]|uniref:uncharacterized protein LOC126656676 n=1 Tax=Mercurialis annua TaxID=3986 RepID=UPI0024AC90C8|nr:uncharacterized protein LOC126656676 [Mercurialis annua]